MKTYVTSVLAIAFLCISFIEGRSYVKTTNNKVRIVGGQTANAGQYPSAAAVYVNTPDGTYFCGGSLISDQWVLSAANCISGGLVFQVVLGSTTLQGNDANRLTLSTSVYVIHPDYNPDTFAHDIGLIQFHLPITFTDYIQPIYLTTTHLIDGMTTTAIGWGQLDDEHAGLVNELQFVSVTTISNTECQMSYANEILQDMVCVAGNYNEGTCMGDNGSPLMITLNHHHWHVGVASFISANGCESVDPSGYTRTYPHIEWIKNVTGIA